MYLNNVIICFYLIDYILSKKPYRHLLAKNNYFVGSLFKQARYKIVIFAILYCVVEQDLYKKTKKNILVVLRLFFGFSLVFARFFFSRNNYQINNI